MLQLWGFMKVVDVYINLNGRHYINYSGYLATWFVTKFCSGRHNSDVAGIYESSGCLQKKHSVWILKSTV